MRLAGCSVRVGLTSVVSALVALLGNQWPTMTLIQNQVHLSFFLTSFARSANYIETISKWPEDLQDAIATARTRSVPLPRLQIKSRWSRKHHGLKITPVARLFT
jgi:hypothetical protein